MGGSIHNIGLNRYKTPKSNDDFEGTVETLSISVKENNWYLGPAMSQVAKETRAILYYKDYRDYESALAQIRGLWQQFAEEKLKWDPYLISETSVMTSKQLQQVHRSLRWRICSSTESYRTSPVSPFLVRQRSDYG